MSVDREKEIEGNDSKTTSPRQKIDQRLQAAYDSPPTKNRSPELVPLAAEYEKMKKSLRALVMVVKKYAEKTKHVNDSREALVNHLGFMSQNSPIYSEIGLGLDAVSEEALAQICDSAESGNSVTHILENRADSDSRSLFALQKFATAQSVCNQQEYQQHVAAWAMEWEQGVTERIDRQLKNVRKLQGDRDHYEKKVETLRRRANDMESKGKSSPVPQVEKLDRNEVKLKESFILHENEAGRVCALIEAATQDGWLELYNLCRNYMKWESNRVGRESDTYSQLAGTLDAMKGTYKRTSQVSISKKGGSKTKADKSARVKSSKK